MGVNVQMKPKAEPVYPSMMENLKAYRVVWVEPNSKLGDQLKVDDVVINLPTSYGFIVFNCTRSIAPLASSGSSLNMFKCLRAFDVQSITLTFDDETRPA